MVHGRDGGKARTANVILQQAMRSRMSNPEGSIWQEPNGRHTFR
jgi:hypothetical protein